MGSPRRFSLKGKIVFQASAPTCARIVGFCALAVAIGCVPVTPIDDTTPPEQVLSFVPELPPATSTPTPSGQAQTFTTRHVEVEPNNNWTQAEAVAFGGSVELVGTISSSTTVKDVDIFRLGPAAAGMRLQADLSVNGTGDVQIGFFDAFGRILAYVDPISPTAGPDRVDIVLREATDEVYVVLAGRSSSTALRNYTVQIGLQPGSVLPAPTQVVVLAFAGASQVRIGSRAPVNVPAFDIAAVNPAFAGLTEAAITRLMEMVREDYQGLNVAFYRDNDAGLPAGHRTTIYFGTSDTRLLGLADSIDPFNGNPSQSAIIYTDTFSLFNPLQPGFEGTIQVLANVTSHEAGHLLGLRHTSDPEDLMDVTATARQMLMDQWFKTSPLHTSVLPTGLQDSPTMLSWSVGGTLEPPMAFKQVARAKALLPGDPALDFYIPRSLLGDCGCLDCEHPYEDADEEMDID